MALLVETVTGRTMTELRAARDRVQDADMIELRLDGVEDIDVSGALEGRTRPAILTCRPRWEGGRFGGSEEERKRILADALHLGAEYVDLEWRGGFESLIASCGGARVVVSSHDFDGMPPDLAERVRAMRATGADVVKIAVTTATLSDTLSLRALTHRGRTVVVGMGDAGLPTRLLAAHYGSYWTYAGDGAAPGQIPAARMLGEFRFRRVGRETAIYGVVGNPVLRSLSPAMHNGWFEERGINAVHVPMQTATFDDFLAFADGLGVAGVSVTIPFKRDALECAVRADGETRRIGAANTLRRTADGWEAANTDVHGFLASLEPAFEPAALRHGSGHPERQSRGEAGPHDSTLHGSTRPDSSHNVGAGFSRREGASSSNVGAGFSRLEGARVSVLGAGGAARAVVVALLSRGARVTVHARREGQARDLAALGAAVGPWPPEPGSWDMLVNCTPLGGVLSPDESPLPEGPFDGRLVYDLVYQPRETRLLREARAAGCETIGGLAMLAAQAEKQFEWWTGQCPPAVVAPNVSSAKG